MDKYDIWRVGLDYEGLRTIEATDMREAFEYFAGSRESMAKIAGQTWLIGPAHDEDGTWWRAYSVVEDPASSHVKSYMIVLVDEQ